MLLMDDTCAAQCTPGTYQKPYDNACEKCPFKHCLECPLGETCTKCDALYRPASSSSVSDITFSDGSSKSSSYGSVAGPKTGAGVTSGKCVSACGEGTYQNHADRECTACHHLCLMCQGSTKHDCLQCRKKALTLLKRDKRISCVLECPVGYFKHTENSLCLPCDAKCATCETSEKCLSCNEPYALEKDQCVAACSEAHYHDPKTNECIPCSVYLNCSECSLQGGCTMCKPGAYFLNDVCINDCGPGFYANDKHCVQCSQDHGDHCSKCTKEGCLKCQPGFELSTATANVEWKTTCIVQKVTTTKTTTPAATSKVATPTTAATPTPAGTQATKMPHRLTASNNTQIQATTTSTQDTKIDENTTATVKTIFEGNKANNNSNAITTNESTTIFSSLNNSSSETIEIPTKTKSNATEQLNKENNTTTPTTTTPLSTSTTTTTPSTTKTTTNLSLTTDNRTSAQSNSKTDDHVAKTESRITTSTTKITTEPITVSSQEDTTEVAETTTPGKVSNDMKKTSESDVTTTSQHAEKTQTTSDPRTVEGVQEVNIKVSPLKMDKASENPGHVEFSASEEDITDQEDDTGEQPKAEQVKSYFLFLLLSVSPVVFKVNIQGYFM